MKIKRIRHRRYIAVVTAMIISGLLSITVYAGEWVETASNSWQYVENSDLATGWKEMEGHWYYFNSDGIMQTGWIKDENNNQWYYLSKNSGVWESKPVMDEITAVHLLENALIRVNLYQDEELSLIYKVNEVTMDKIKVSVGTEKLPEVFSTINTYEIDKKTGRAKAVVGDDLSLY
jgi:hypothetical protein